MQERRITSPIRRAEISFIERREQAENLYELGLLAKDVSDVARELRRQGQIEQAELAYLFRAGVLVDALEKKRAFRYEGLEVGRARVRKVDRNVANRLLLRFSNENGEKIDLLETFTRLQSICGSTEKADSLVHPLDILDVQIIHKR